MSAKCVICRMSLYKPSAYRPPPQTTEIAAPVAVRYSFAFISSIAVVLIAGLASSFFYLTFFGGIAPVILHTLPTGTINITFNLPRAYTMQIAFP